MNSNLNQRGTAASVKSPRGVWGGLASTLSVGLVAVTLVGCVVAPPREQRVYQQDRQPVYSSYAQVGQVVAIDRIRLGRPTSGVGGLVGGVAGAVVGNQMGKGNGRAGMTVIGGVAGAVIGNQVEQNRNGEGPEVFRISVRLNDGNVRAFDYEDMGNIGVGDRVRVEDNRIFLY